jgi:hypothetical protein
MCKFFRKKNFTSLAFSRHLGGLHIPRMNVNNQPANQPATVGRQQQQGRQRERSNIAHFTSTEIQGLLQVIEDIIPVHGEEWEDVSQSYAANFPTSQRTSESLERKFQQLYRVKKPMGNPFCPHEVRMAKRLRHLITTKCEIDDAEGGSLPSDVSVDDDVIGDENVGEDEDDEFTARNDMVLAQAPPIEVPQVARGNGVLAPLPQNKIGIAASRKRAALKTKSDDILEVHKLKILQKEEEREAERERYEREREEIASEMRMRRKEEERCFRHEAEMRKAEAKALREEVRAEAESCREEAKAFREMMLFMTLGKKHVGNNN